MKIAALCAWLICVSLGALALAACSNPPLGEDVVAQARAGGQIAFDVVNIDDAVLTALQAQRPPAFHERFKKYLPPPELPIAVGDTVSVVIWESAANGLFGNSLSDLSARVDRLPGLSGAAGQSQGLAASSDGMARLFGGTAAQGGTAALGGSPALGGAAGQGLAAAGIAPGAAAGLTTGIRPGLAPGAAAGLTTGIRPGLAAETAAGQGQLRGAQSGRLEGLLEAAAQSGRPGTRIPDQAVGPDGMISIPYAGRIAVAGRTAVEVQRTIEELLGPKALDPQVLVITKQSAANTVSVAGEIIRGARIPLSPGGDRLLQVIAAAGGAKAPPGETFVRLSRGGVTATVPLGTLVAEPDQDIFAEPGDVLTLVQRRQSFSVFGATGRNNAINFNSDRLSLTEALAKAGGLLDDRADPRAVFLFRYEPVNLVRSLDQPIAAGAPAGLSPIVYRLDLMEAGSYHLAGRFPVRDKDVIFVADARARPIYQFFQALSQITGPIQTGLLICSYSVC